MRPIALAALLTLFTSGSSFAGPDIYIFDVLHRANYHAAYERMFRSEHGVPNWIATADAASEATTNAGETKNIDGTVQEVFDLCKPHDCDGNSFVVFFSKYGDIAKGALSDGGHVRLFGNPSADEATAMMSYLY